jgi:hypothetical protein
MTGEPFPFQALHALGPPGTLDEIATLASLASYRVRRPLTDPAGPRQRAVPGLGSSSDDPRV